VVVVHWGGYPADLDRIADARERCYERFGFRPYVIEDCAHGWASTFGGRPLGTHGNLCAFSFQAIKHLTCGDGGALCVPTPDLYRRAKLLRWYGIDREKRTDSRHDGNVAEYGFKFHMNDINATIGLENLEIVDALVDRHRSNAQFYDERLRGIPGLTQLQQGRSNRVSSAWIYTVLVENRPAFMRRMEEAGIAVSPVHSRNDTHQCVAEFTAPLPVLDSVAERMIAIPVGWWVGDDDRERIAATVERGW
jgi:dTDP-4-amino-4,6-dideoxygalactose transaminase